MCLVRNGFTFIDDCNRMSWIFSLKSKSDVSSVLPNFHIMIQNQFGVKIKKFGSDTDYLIKFYIHIFKKKKKLSLNPLALILHNKMK